LLSVSWLIEKYQAAFAVDIIFFSPTPLAHTKYSRQMKVKKAINELRYGT